MMQYYIYILVKIIIAAILTVLFGNGVVVLFNRIPARWFEDTVIDEDGQMHKAIPPDLIEDMSGGRQRITSTPWKYIFTAFFGVIGVFLALREPMQYEIASMIVIAIVLEMAIADVKYRVVPDQLILAFAVSAVGFLSYIDIRNMILGAVIGLAIGVLTYGLGRLIYKRETIGGADIKFYACTGFVTGTAGVLSVVIGTALLMAIHTLIIAIKGEEHEQSRPMLAYSFVVITLYLLFYSQISLYIQV